MQDIGINLVDNGPFICWATTGVSTPLEDACAIHCGDTFFCSAMEDAFFDTEPITTNQQMEDALTAMYWLRYENMLESPAMLEEIPFASIESCSADTQMAGNAIIVEARNAIN